MIFTSFEYCVFFIVVLLVRSAIQDLGTEKWFLLVASYVFYMSWSIPCSLLIFCTSIFDYGVGLGLGRVVQPKGRKALLVASVCVNLGVLAYFKYTNFLVDNVWWGIRALGVNSARHHFDIILPAGISFFTFQSMTYTIETYRGNMKACHSPRDFLLFVAFFPQLLAGPINRAADLLPQFARRLRPTVQEFETGLVQFALGAIKKLVISDQIAPNVDTIFRGPGNYDGFTLLQGAIGYSIQIYCDFSGYSDMAIGSARMLGFRFMENFQMPYSSLSITEFWRRWHISLSTWLRDYLYIPLGGNRLGSGRTYFNLMTTMVLGGLWHGASWNFVFWGALHGGALAVHKGWKALVGHERSSEPRGLVRFMTLGLSRILTLSTVVLGWIFFRAETWNGAMTFVRRILVWNTSGVRLISPYILMALAGVIFAHVLINKDREWSQDVVLYTPLKRAAIYAGVLLLLVSLSATDSAPFIYFQF